jgi:hypothetical protein
MMGLNDRFYIKKSIVENYFFEYKKSTLVINEGAI